MNQSPEGKEYVPNAFVDALWNIADAMRREAEERDQSASSNSGQ